MNHIPRPAAGGGLSPAAYPLLARQRRRDGDKLHLKNETDWNTADLKRFVRAALRYLGVSEDRNVRITNRRSLDAIGASGCAYLNSRSMTVRLPRPIYRATIVGDDGAREEWRRREVMHEVDLRDFAYVFLHELEHNLGLEHRQMRRSRKVFTPWLAGLVVRAKAEKAKPAPLPAGERRALTREAREAKARQRLALWERKMRLAKTKVAAWRRKVARYDRIQAACRAGVKP